MSRMRNLRNTFSGGVLSPDSWGNVDIEQYNNSLVECSNFLKQPTGGLFKRQGTVFLAGILNPTRKTKLVKYLLSTDESYIIVLQIQSTADSTYLLYAQAFNVNNLKRIETNIDFGQKYPGLNEETFETLSFLQSQSGLLIFFSSVILRVTKETTALNFSQVGLTVPPFSQDIGCKLFIFDNGDPKSEIELGKCVLCTDNEERYRYAYGTYSNYGEGPWEKDTFDAWLPTVATKVWEEPAVEIKQAFWAEYTAASAAGPVLLLLTYSSSDVAKPNLNWVLKITSVEWKWDSNDDKKTKAKTPIIINYTRVSEYCNKTVVTGGGNEDVTLTQDFPPWGKKTGADSAPRYCNCAIQSMVRMSSPCDLLYRTSYEGRLYLAHQLERRPNLIVGSSRTYDDWLNFMPGVNAGDALQENITSDLGMTFIQWIIGAQRLFIGTSDGVYIFGSLSAAEDQSITPTNARAKKISSISTSNIQPIYAMDTIFFHDSSNTKIYEVIINDNNNFYAINEISMLAKHLFSSGISSHAFMQNPMRLYWCSMNDGSLVSISYMKNIGSLAATSHLLGTYPGNSKVSVNGIISINKGDNNILVIDVTRYKANLSQRSLETFNYSIKKDPCELRCFYLDCGDEFLEAHQFNALEFRETVSVGFLINHPPTLENNLLTSFFVEAIPDISGWAFKRKNVIDPQLGDGYSRYFDIKKRTDYWDFYLIGKDGNVLDAATIPKLTGVDSFYCYVSGTRAQSLILSEIKENGFGLKLAIPIGMLPPAYMSEPMNVRFFDWNVRCKAHIDDPYAPLIENTDVLFQPTAVNGSFTCPLIFENILDRGASIAIEMLLSKLSFFGGDIIKRTEARIYFDDMTTVKAEDRFYLALAPHFGGFIEKQEIVLTDEKSDKYKYNCFAYPDGENVTPPPGVKNEYQGSIGYAYKQKQLFTPVNPILRDCKNIYAVLNDNYYLANVDRDGVVEIPNFGDYGVEYFYYMAIGFGYGCQLRTTPFYMQNPIVGNMLGMTSHQTNVVLQLYDSVGGSISGSSFNNMVSLDYSGTYKDVALVSAPVEPSSDQYQQSVYLSQDAPAPFNVLSITQNVIVEDGQP